ncbi:DMT family transporter [Alkalinema sp. FACHB-956]|uniref:EamA family transporter n=1 Tax=Alkalinema sp. FACHB-956 TaxID=2692768 RepID=UPI001686ACA5|nr:DMT family transporter [Alkalinema sp. FACHB-956]MBD2327707.1 DMT family transporter [Alkalinema sp. FACHB-956]
MSSVTPSFLPSWMLPTLGAMLCWGLWGFIPKLTTQYLSPKSAILYEVLGAVLFASLLVILFQVRPQVHPIGIPLALSTGMLGFLGAFCFLNAVTSGPVTLVATISALYPIVSVLLAVTFLREPLSLRQGIGIALGLVAMLLITTGE